MVDTHKDYVSSSNLTNKFLNELEHVLFHLKDAENKINLKKIIKCYGKGYNTTKLMSRTVQLESYFIIRGK
ncbi:MAG: hypothetical protein KO202_07600 [Methanobacteriaceae archaeon]|jgi:hypothetical protein|nr:hypothetical protein [Methanobacteriaceae archaeon]